MPVTRVCDIHPMTVDIHFARQIYPCKNFEIIASDIRKVEFLTNGHRAIVKYFPLSIARASFSSAWPHTMLKRTIAIVPRRVVVVRTIPLVSFAIVWRRLLIIACLVEAECCPRVNVLTSLQYPTAVAQISNVRSYSDLACCTDASTVKGCGGDCCST